MEAMHAEYSTKRRQPPAHLLADAVAAGRQRRPLLLAQLDVVHHLWGVAVQQCSGAVVQQCSLFIQTCSLGVRQVQ